MGVDTEEFERELTRMLLPRNPDERRKRVLVLLTESYKLRDELASAHERLEACMSIVAALAVYGENVNLPALVEKARALNEAQP